MCIEIKILEEKIQSGTVVDPGVVELFRANLVVRINSSRQSGLWKLDFLDSHSCFTIKKLFV